MDVGIIGGGAVGLLLAAYLGREHHVHIYTRRAEQQEALKKNGVYCEELKKTTMVASYLTKDGINSHDLLFITVKQNQLCALLKEDLPKETPLVFLQNGMSHLELLPVNNYTCWIGSVEHGASKESDSYVKHLGNGRLRMASYHQDENLSLIIERLHQNDFPVEYHRDHLEMLADKLLINTVINPLTALFGVTNKKIIENDSLQKIAKELCKEACEVLKRSFEKEWPKVVSVALNTGDNQSSMLKDILSGRKTEIDGICGYILQQSDRAPYHRFVVDAIHALEMKEGW